MAGIGRIGVVNQAVREYEQARMKTERFDFRPGDTVRVSVRIVEGEKERIQDFEGLCIRRHGAGMNETFTVRRISYGVGMERIFALHAPRVENIRVVRRGKVRRANLGYLRNVRGKQARVSEDILRTRKLAAQMAEMAGQEVSEDVLEKDAQEEIAHMEEAAEKAETVAAEVASEQDGAQEEAADSQGADTEEKKD